MNRYLLFTLAFCLFLLFGSGSAVAGLHINLSGSSYATSGQESFKVYKIQIPGFEGTYWAEFRERRRSENTFVGMVLLTTPAKLCYCSPSTKTSE